MSNFIFEDYAEALLKQNPEWRPILAYEGNEYTKGYPDFSDRYLISSNGLVKTLKTNKLKQLTISRCPYLEVKLNKKKEYKIRVHRLVALNFLPPCPGPQGTKKGHYVVNHKDKNKLNNDVCNLEWLTSSDNIRHRIDCPFLSLKDIEEIKNDNRKAYKIIRHYNISMSTLYRIRNNKRAYSEFNVV